MQLFCTLLFAIIIVIRVPHCVCEYVIVTLVATTTASAISLPKPFAEGNPVEWFQKYDICCTANGWEIEAKAKRLPTLLEREALAVWLELSEAEQKSYKDAKAKISSE